jgi:hypothetical protein
MADELARDIRIMGLAQLNPPNPAFRAEKALLLGFTHMGHRTVP